ncbi:anaerobic sulfatase maturase [Silvibacterium dinghuense]|uniref:Anaerobic sulfatase maturase n=1 Tax=Silvibacterium dinghuense TaxID=1560006 RepID=A0A4Q1SJI0_9BACT|nr:anaerobic sulfatase maturase [Silvibacterium dinghuense]RXS97593.1 anaerobic sulfatase maturase [Silvibacterium dinghuense]GGH00318.1 regulatory protein [Silvibacterium dinghuense]
MNSFHIMAKPHGPICNLDCTYCYYLEKENLYPRSGREFHMADDVLESYIRQYIAAHPSSHVSFAWQGGEPTLLGVPYFERVVALQKQYANGKTIENALQTNGTLLDDVWGEFLAKNHFLVGLSIDGPAHLHDAYRVDKGGKPSFARVVRGLDILKKHGVAFNTLTVVNRKNSYHALEVYRFLKQIGSRYLQFIPVVEQLAEAPDHNGLRLLKPYSQTKTHVSDWSVESLQFGRFLQEIFDEWVVNDVGHVYVQAFDVALESWAGLPQSLCVFSPTCGNALALEHNGDLYSCDHFVYPENRLGNIAEQPLLRILNSPQQSRFGKAKETGLPSDCRSCDVRFACNGECPKHRFSSTSSGEYGLNYLCAGYKHFFHHIDPYMRFMANELRQRGVSARVMEWARHQREATTVTA